MKLLFIVPHEIHSYDSKWVRENPCGGTEKAAMFLVEALTKLGEETRLVTAWDQVAAIDTEWPDVVITQHAELFLRFGKDVGKVWWCHQASDRPIIRDGTRLARRHADFVVTLSAFHQQDFQRELGLESDVIGLGVWRSELAPVVKKDPAALIYASVPQRGLDTVPDLFREILEAEPEATITICSSNATWGRPEWDKPFEGLFTELRSLRGVTLLPSQPQRALFELFARSSVFFYPATYAETFCLAMAEAMAHGCVPIVTGVGALPERWVTSSRPVRQAVAAIQRARVRPAHVTCPPDWLEIAERWLSLLS